jgi:hypothetical protein
MGSRKDGDFSDLDEQPASACGGCRPRGRVRRRARARAARVSDRRDRPAQATRGRGRRRGRAGDDRGPRVRSHQGRSQIRPTRHAYACPAGCAGHDRARGTSVTRACSGFASGRSRTATGKGSIRRVVHITLDDGERRIELWEPGPEAFPGRAEEGGMGSPRVRPVWWRPHVRFRSAATARRRRTDSGGYCWFHSVSSADQSSMSMASSV